MKQASMPPSIPLVNKQIHILFFGLLYTLALKRKKEILLFLY